MEYTKDVILNVHYEKNDLKNVNFRKGNLRKYLLKKMENDGYFSLTICVSVIAFLFDFFVIKSFVDIIKFI